jgi:hypothetical protein
MKKGSLGLCRSNYAGKGEVAARLEARDCKYVSTDHYPVVYMKLPSDEH